MSHPRIEEVSDSDLSDPSEGDIDDFVDSDIMRRVEPPSSAVAAPAAATQQPRPAQQQQAAQMFPGQPQQASSNLQPADIAGYQCLYPIYFDASRTRAEGRRVPAKLAVRNPLAREIANACAALRLSPVFEAMKSHPQDWANPGRVRVNLRDPNNPYAKQVKNKHHLYVLVAQHLQRTPTTDQSESLRRVRIHGLPGHPADGEPWPKAPVPRGWKLNELLPAYSSAMTGGGVSENAFRDIMKEMGGMGGPGGPGGMGGMGDMLSMLGGGPGPSGSSGAGAAADQAGAAKKKKGKGK
ncbi:signal recognition particle, SRP19 subunit [Xylariales sp. PMI_506]|nr:signal recognition particle, SRP19 subunit [Xylariales sp. PMI_506]